MSSAAQKYDLSTPAPLPRESKRRLAAQQELLAEQLRIHLRRLLRMRVDMSVAVPDVVRVRHFSSFLEGKAWWFSGGGKQDPAGRSVLVGCAPGLIYAAIDRILGGPGTAPVPAKPPTAIEFEFGMRFLRDVFNGFVKALTLAPLHLDVVPHEPLSEPLLTYTPDLEEPFARIACKVKLLDGEHELLLCISRALLEATEPKDAETKSGSQQLATPVAESPIELMVELARCQLTLQDAAKLEKGDVVLFDLPPGEPLEVKVQGKTRLRGKLGTHLGRYAIEVTTIVEPERPVAESAPTPPPAAKAAAAGASISRSARTKGE